MTFTLAQAAVPGSANALTLTLTLASPTTAGNCLIVCVGTSSTAAASAVASVKLGGSVGNFAAEETSGTSGSLQGRAEIWADPNCAGGQTAVLITVAGGSGANTGIGAVVYEFTGIPTSSAVDQVHPGQGTSTPWSSGSTPTTTQASELWVGAYCGSDFAGGKTITPPAAFTNIATQLATVTYFTAGYQIVSSTGAAAYAGTGNSGTQSWGAAVATFKPLSTISGSATAAGAGSVAATAAVSPIAPVTGAGALMAAGVSAGVSGVAGAGALGAIASVSGTATLSGDGAASASGISFSGELTEMDGGGSLTAAPSVGSSSALASSSSIAALATTEPVISPAAISGMTAAGYVQGSVTMAGSGTIAGSGVSTVIAGLAGTGSLAAFVSVQINADLAATGAVSANEGQPGIGTLVGAGSLSAHAQPFTPASLAGGGSLAASGSVITHYRRHWGRAPEYVSKSGAVMR